MQVWLDEVLGTFEDTDLGLSGLQQGLDELFSPVDLDDIDLDDTDFEDMNFEDMNFADMNFDDSGSEQGPDEEFGALDDTDFGESGLEFPQENSSLEAPNYPPGTVLAEQFTPVVENIQDSAPSVIRENRPASERPLNAEKKRHDTSET